MFLSIRNKFYMLFFSYMFLFSPQKFLFSPQKFLFYTILFIFNIQVKYTTIWVHYLFRNILNTAIIFHGTTHRNSQQILLYHFSLQKYLFTVRIPISWIWTSFKLSNLQKSSIHGRKYNGTSPTFTFHKLYHVFKS